MKIEEEHIQLLAAMAELLELEENFGFVPEFNAKRPFGNSVRAIVAADAHEVMGGDRDEFDLNDDEEVEGTLEWVRECTPVLKAILRSDRLHEFVGMEIRTEERGT